MNLLDTQDAIVAQLSLLSQDIYDGSIPEDTKLKFDSNGNLLPYIVIEHAGVTPTITRPITGVAGASGESSVTVMCIGPTQRSSRQVAALVRENLTGFQPTSSGELIPISSPFTYIDSVSKPSRYISEITFSFILNTVW